MNNDLLNQLYEKIEWARNKEDWELFNLLWGLMEFLENTKKQLADYEKANELLYKYIEKH